MRSEAVSKWKVFDTEIGDVKGFDLVKHNQHSPDHRHRLGKAETGNSKELHDEFREWISKTKGKRI